MVPGITAASAAAAAAGVTLTQRGVARGVSLLTPAVGRDEAPNPQWLRAAATGATVAVYMAGRRSAQVARQLLKAGYAPDTPVVIAAGVETADQRLAHSHLEALATTAGHRHRRQSLRLADWRGGTAATARCADGRCGHCRGRCQRESRVDRRLNAKRLVAEHESRPWCV